MRRATAFLLRMTAAVLAVAADQLAPSETEPEPEPDDDVVYEDPAIGECDLDLPWPERRPSCVNYPHEAYYASE